MQLKLNPLKQRGSRNPFCPYYGTCLDHAVQRRWEYWNCSACPFGLSKQHLRETPNMCSRDHWYRIPRRVFLELMD